MAHVAGALKNLLPQRVVRSAQLRMRFRKFAKLNGLVYFGVVHADDDHDPVRGFTTSVDQVDSYVMHGTIQGHDVTLLERTVTHTSSPVGKTHLHDHTWLIASVVHMVEHAPHILLLSHSHPRLHEEAIAIRHNHREHLPLESGLDACFLAYTNPRDADDFRDHINEELVTLLVSRLEYDYEFDEHALYIYSHNKNPTPDDLNRLLVTALSLAKSYETEIPEH